MIPWVPDRGLTSLRALKGEQHDRMRVRRKRKRHKRKQGDALKRYQSRFDWVATIPGEG
jgi:hypothetical protein